MASGVPCRLCGSDGLLLADRGDVALYRCARCGFVSGRPVVPLSPEDYYDNYYQGPQPAGPAARYEEWLACAEARVGRGRLLEVGAGVGGFVRVALRRGWTVEATELSRTALALLSTTSATCFAGDLEEAHYTDGRFDLVVSLEVLEHLGDPPRHLKEICRIVRPGGLLLLTTPNFDGFSRKTLGLRWRVVHAEHLGYFTTRTLGTALSQAGFREIDVRSRSLDVTAWKDPTKVTPFDPAVSAWLRDFIDRSLVLRGVKNVVNRGLNVLGLGDSLLAWARK